MGLGKTIITLSLLNCLETTFSEFWENPDADEADEPEYGISVIVTPATIQDQWVKEALTWASAIPFYKFSDVNQP